MAVLHRITTSSPFSQHVPWFTWHSTRPMAERVRRWWVNSRLCRNAAPPLPSAPTGVESRLMQLCLLYNQCQLLPSLLTTSTGWMFTGRSCSAQNNNRLKKTPRVLYTGNSPLKSQTASYIYCDGLLVIIEIITQSRLLIISKEAYHGKKNFLKIIMMFLICYLDSRRVWRFVIEQEADVKTCQCWDISNTRSIKACVSILNGIIHDWGGAEKQKPTFFINRFHILCETHLNGTYSSNCIKKGRGPRECGKRDPSLSYFSRDGGSNVASASCVWSMYCMLSPCFRKIPLGTPVFPHSAIRLRGISKLTMTYSCSWLPCIGCRSPYSPARIRGQQMDQDRSYQIS